MHHQNHMVRHLISQAELKTKEEEDKLKKLVNNEAGIEKMDMINHISDKWF